MTTLVTWLRVQHAGAPRWFLGSVAMMAGVLGVVFATHSGS